ncbi:MAG: MTH1187 family thiamine-binding protein [Thermodesulfobacteriota bacterium]|nr:MTH1187 family thiamine-binding protein [Thermodesulfobacteriota bacterium]
MSTLINFSVFPLDKGESVSVYVARALKIVRDSGLAYKLNSMGTTIEGERDEVMDVVNRCFDEIKKDCDRVYMTLNADYRKGKSGRIESKVKSVESKLMAS